jgi:hypothetical protein
MRATITFLLALLLCVLLPGAAHGQCQIQTYTSYAVSFSAAPDSAGSDMLTSVVVDGSAGMQMIATGNCPDSIITQFNNNVQNISHFPSVLNQIGSAGGWSQGPSFCAVCYSSYQTNLDSGPVSLGQELPVSYGGEVVCSVAGLIFSTSGNGFISLHRTTYKYASIDPNGVCTYNVYCITSQHICGPDVVTVQGPCPLTYFITSWIKFRVGMHSICFPVFGPSGRLSETWLACN